MYEEHVDIKHLEMINLDFIGIIRHAELYVTLLRKKEQNKNLLSMKLYFTSNPDCNFDETQVINKLNNVFG